MRGKNVVQKSFIGIIFHAQNNKTYDAVYCRPFNFFAADSVKKVHAIQYISHPIYTWKKLREDKNGQYEKEIVNPPNPKSWFKMILVVDNKNIKAFINDSKEASIDVQKISNFQKGKIGIFVGDNSDGDFKNITKEYIK